MIKRKLQEFIEQQALFDVQDRLLLAISAGIDSVVLLHLLLDLGYRPALIHCNFKLRGTASDADEIFVRELAKQHQLACFVAAFDTSQEAKKAGLSIQMMARQLRYDFFDRIRQEHGYDYILTAHHLDDRIETFLLNFLRASGLTGLRSIPAKNGYTRRPLLAVNRQEIDRYQQKNNIAFREDESNASDKYQRNFLRHHVLPKLYELAPHLAERSQQNFEYLEQMHYLYEQQVAYLKNDMLKETAAAGARLDLEKLRKHPAKESLLWAFLQNYGFHKEQLKQVLSARVGTVLKTPTHEAVVSAHELLIEKKTATAQLDQAFWTEDQDTFSFNGYCFEKEEVSSAESFKSGKQQLLLPQQALVYPLELRYWQAGDYFQPFGMKGKSQKLKKFFSNNKINRLERKRIPLLFNGDGRMIWLVGQRSDERFRVQKGQEVVCIKWKQL